MCVFTLNQINIAMFYEYIPLHNYVYKPIFTFNQMIIIINISEMTMQFLEVKKFSLNQQLLLNKEAVYTV